MFLKTTHIKTVTLLALISAQRIQTLTNIEWDLIKVEEQDIKIFIPEKLKTSGKNRLQPVLILPFCREEPKLCLRLTILEYIRQTKSLRPVQKTLSCREQSDNRTLDQKPFGSFWNRHRYLFHSFFKACIYIHSLES